MRDCMDRYGSIEYAQKVAHALTGAALHEFEIAYAGVADSRDRRFIEAIATWAIERS